MDHGKSSSCADHKNSRHGLIDQVLVVLKDILFNSIKSQVSGGVTDDLSLKMIK